MKLKALIAEDNNARASELYALLVAAGVEVMCVDNVTDALEAISDLELGDLVFIDSMLYESRFNRGIDPQAGVRLCAGFMAAKKACHLFWHSEANLPMEARYMGCIQVEIPHATSVLTTLPTLPPVSTDMSEYGKDLFADLDRGASSFDPLQALLFLTTGYLAAFGDPMDLPESLMKEELERLPEPHRKWLRFESEKLSKKYLYLVGDNDKPGWFDQALPGLDTLGKDLSRLPPWLSEPGPLALQRLERYLDRSPIKRLHYVSSLCPENEAVDDSVESIYSYSLRAFSDLAISLTTSEQQPSWDATSYEFIDQGRTALVLLAQVHGTSRYGNDWLNDWDGLRHDDLKNRLKLDLSSNIAGLSGKAGARVLDHHFKEHFEREWPEFKERVENALARFISVIPTNHMVRDLLPGVDSERLTYLGKLLGYLWLCGKSVQAERDFVGSVLARANESFTEMIVHLGSWSQENPEDLMPVLVTFKDACQELQQAMYGFPKEVWL